MCARAPLRVYALFVSSRPRERAYTRLSFAYTTYLYTYISLYVYDTYIIRERVYTYAYGHAQARRNRVARYRINANQAAKRLCECARAWLIFRIICYNDACYVWYFFSLYFFFFFSYIKPNLRSFRTKGRTKGRSCLSLSLSRPT